MEMHVETKHFDKVMAYKGAKKIFAIRLVFYIHLSIYLSANCLLLGINLITFPGIYWFIWPLLGWGIGIFCHFLYAYLWIDTSSRTKMQEEAFEQKVVFYLHLTAYICVNLLLGVVNLFAITHTIWCIWVLLGWGIGLFYHFLFTFIYRGWAIKKWQHRKTVEIMKKYFDVDASEELEGNNKPGQK